MRLDAECLIGWYSWCLNAYKLQPCAFPAAAQLRTLMGGARSPAEWVHPATLLANTDPTRKCGRGYPLLPPRIVPLAETKVLILADSSVLTHGLGKASKTTNVHAQVKEAGWTQSVVWPQAGAGLLDLCRWLDCYNAAYGVGVRGPSDKLVP